MSLCAEVGHSNVILDVKLCASIRPSKQSARRSRLPRQHCSPRLYSAFLSPQFSLLGRSWSSKSSSSFSVAVRSPCRASLEALVFDCDGVILESEDLHRRAYNATFSHFNVRCPGATESLQWSSEFYDQLQNQIGGGKPKMRWYFKTYGWPSSSVYTAAPEGDAEREELVDALQDWKTEKYKEIIASGSVKPRPGVLQLMDEAEEKGIKLAICSAATKSSVVFCLTNLLGKERLDKLDCFLAGDDVEKKKPDPSIYVEAVKRLNVPAGQCLVVEDSVIGLQAALGAGLKCIISYTSSTSNQDFGGASGVYPDLGSVRLQHLEELMERSVTVA